MSTTVVLDEVDHEEAKQELATRAADATASSDTLGRLVCL